MAENKDYILMSDSTCDLPPELCKQMGVEILKLSFEIDGTSHKDGDMDYHEFYDKMRNGSLTKTSQLSPSQEETAFEKYVKKGIPVLYLAFSSGLSGTYNSACIARDSLTEKYPDAKIIVVDSLCASTGQGLLLYKGWEKKQQGMGIDELAAWTEEHKSEVQHWFFSSDLTFFVRGGRISKAAGLVGGMLKICPVMDVEPDGSLAVKEKIRTKAKAVNRVVEKMEELAEGGLDYSGKCFISQSECIDDAQEVARRIEAKFPKLNGKVEIFPIGATIGVHTGPGTVALFFWGEKRA